MVKVLDNWKGSVLVTLRIMSLALVGDMNKLVWPYSISNDFRSKLTRSCLIPGLTQWTAERRVPPTTAELPLRVAPTGAPKGPPGAEDALSKVRC